MSSARETILADIRRHLRNTDPMPRPQVLTSRPPDMGAPVARFTAALEAVGGHVHRTGSPEQAKGCVLDLLEKYLGNGGGVFTSATPTLRAWLSSTGHCVVGPDGPREDQLEAGLEDPAVLPLVQHAKREGAEVVVVTAAVEAEIAGLDEEERAEFLESLGLEEPGLNRLIRSAYGLLDLITYFTAGEKECRAWTISEGTLAPGAAGVIHSDFERGFIRAEVINWSTLIECGSEANAKSKGLMRVEGKEYLVKDGDVMHFRFNV